MTIRADLHKNRYFYGIIKLSGDRGYNISIKSCIDTVVHIGDNTLKILF